MKRVMDVCISAVLLLFALPVLTLVALLIRLSSSGPILFRQTRMGRDFRPFQILKLRTMKVAEPGPPYTMGADPRITRLGTLLRRWKLDEVPQLWNVLRGEMSLVGPRPVLPELTEEFRAQYVQLLRVRPGLTDPASLKYSQEARLLGTVADPMRYFKSVVTPDKLEISLRYIHRRNAGTDLLTLAMTGLICWFPSLASISQALLDPGEGRGFLWNTDAEFKARARSLAARGELRETLRVLQFPRRHGSHAGGLLPWNRPSTSQMGGRSATNEARGRVSLL